jgi:hypothetical protein
MHRSGTVGNEPNKTDILMAQILAMKTAMPVVILFQIPNQPLDPNQKSTLGTRGTMNIKIQV